jgi:competence protein ComEC
MKQMLMLTMLGLVCLVIITGYQYLQFHDGRLHIVFCDVGQGDAILITTPNNQHILVDSGPDKSVLDCLSRYMPFWERTIDLAILTHPHSDHYSGYYYILQRYSVTQFATEDLKNKTAGFVELMRIIADKKIPTHFVLAGDKWRLEKVTLDVAGPTADFLQTTSPGGFIGEGKEFASVITNITYGAFDLLLVGDSQVAGLMDANDHIDSTVTVMQVPHHGSSSGLDEHVLSLLQPHLAVISVGAKNRYGHPTKTTLNLLQTMGVRTLRTDQNGDIEIISDAKEWKVHQQH